MRGRGTPIDEQRFDWFELARYPISKLNDDAFTRVCIIWMNAWSKKPTASATPRPG